MHQYALAEQRKVRPTVLVSATSSPSRMTLAGNSERNVSRSVMSQPRPLRTRRDPSVETMARKPSHFTSKAKSPRVGSDSDRASIGSGRAEYDATAEPEAYATTSSLNPELDGFTVAPVSRKSRLEAERTIACWSQVKRDDRIEYVKALLEWASSDVRQVYIRVTASLAVAVLFVTQIKLEALRRLDRR